MYLTPTLNWTQSQTGEDHLFLNVTILPVATSDQTNLQQSNSFLLTVCQDKSRILHAWECQCVTQNWRAKDSA